MLVLFHIWVCLYPRWDFLFGLVFFGEQGREGQVNFLRVDTDKNVIL